MSVLRSTTLALGLGLSLSAFAAGFQLFGSDDDAKQESAHSVTPKLELSPEAIKALLEKKLDGIEISSVEPSPIEGLYQAFYSGQVIYVSTNGEFLFSGNLVGLTGDKMINYTEKAVIAKTAELSPKRASKIAALKEDDMVVFKAEKEQFAITVFTDVDCAYCRKLHKEVPQLNAKGITVRYLAYPRAGIGSSAYDKLVSVWCADDRQLAMNNAKLKRQFSPKSCTNPIASQYNLVREFGLNGTPALILSDGELIAGYMPYEKLYQHLLTKSKKATQSKSAGK